MIPQRLILQGALGVKAGLGRDSLELDLSVFPEDARTIAIKGDNGAGKTTLMNLGLHPWLNPPHIADIYSQFAERGLRELYWTHAGQEYHSRIEIRNGKTRSQKATLKVKAEDESWHPVTLPDHTQSDGRTKTYHRCLEYILGPQALYFLSAFRAQNAPKLAEHDDVKDLMRDLLALDEPDRLAEQAKRVLRELKRAHADIRAKADDIAALAERIAAIDARLAEIEAASLGQAQAKLDATSAVGLAKVELESAQAGDIDRQRLRQQRLEAEQRVREMTAAEQRCQLAINEATADLDRRLREIKGQQQRALERLERARSLLANREKIATASAEAETLAARINEQEHTQEAVRAQIEQLQALAAKVQTLEAEQAGIARDGKSAKATLDDLVKRAAFVSAVPCHGEGDYAKCPALADAKAAAGKINETAAAVDARRAEWNALNRQISELKTEAGILPEQRSTLQKVQGAITLLRTKLDAARMLAAQASTLAQAERDATEAQAEMDAAIQRHGDEKTAGSERLAALQAELADAHARSILARETLDALPAAEGTDAVEKARAALLAAEQAESAAADKVAAARAEAADNQAERKRLVAKQQQGRAIAERAKRMEAEIADWYLLATGLRGVIDLSIEDAGPGIAALANQLLTDAYGPRFSVRIVTQREQANGVLRECFDISVLDAETGLESSVLHKSGGEQVWVDKALTDAVALYHQESAGQHYECLFADEAEDGLTQERKQQFYRMDRAALELGGYQRKFFISHNPEAWALADVVIDTAGLRGAG